jgi:hypothetical protein
MIELTRCASCGRLIPAEAYHTDGICPYCNPKEAHDSKVAPYSGTLKATEGTTREAVPSDQMNLF